MLGFLSHRRLAELAASAFASRPAGTVAVLGPPALAKALGRAGVTAEAFEGAPPDGDGRFAGLVVPGPTEFAAWLPRLADGARVLVGGRGDGEAAAHGLLAAHVVELAVASARPLVLVGRVDARLQRARTV